MADEEEALARHREFLQELTDRKMEELDAVLEMSAEAGFTPRRSLARTPPTVYSTPLALPATPAQPQLQAGKRLLSSPDEVQEALRRKICGKRQEKSAALPVSGILTTSPGPAPKSPARPGVVPPPPPVSGVSAAKTLFREEDQDPMAEASVAQLVSIATSSTKGIMEAVKAKSSRLNKEEIAAMGAYTERLASVITHLTLRLAEAEKRTADTIRAQEVAPPTAPTREGVQMAAGPPVTYADRLRMGARSTPKPVPGGPTLAIYPVEKDGVLKTAEDTKAFLQKTINPTALGIQVSRLRRVGNAGVVVQTTTADAADKIKGALPPTVRVTEPQARKPLVAIVNVEGDMEGRELLNAVYAQNIGKATDITEGQFKQDCRVAFRKTRQGSSRSTHVLECTPAIRDALIATERVYVDWERYLVRDYVDIICCLKCHGYGHPAKYCKAKNDVCGRCTEPGHRAKDCPLQEPDMKKCATCRGAGKPYEGHRTMALECPARRYAENKAISMVNYG